MNEQLQFLNRHSTPAKALAEPAPDDAQLKQIFEVALHAPDHGKIYPYRFITIRGDARKELSKVFGEAVKRRDPKVSTEYLKKQQDKPLRSPLIVVVVASLIESQKIPEIEQMLSAGTAAHNILLASKAMGFGSIWLTGDNAFDPYVFKALKLADNERIVGFIYIGTETIDTYNPPTIDVDTKIEQWTGA